MKQKTKQFGAITGPRNNPNIWIPCRSQLVKAHPWHPQPSRGSPPWPASHGTVFAASTGFPLFAFLFSIFVFRASSGSGHTSATPSLPLHETASLCLRFLRFSRLFIFSVHGGVARGFIPREGGSGLPRLPASGGLVLFIPNECEGSAVEGSQAEGLSPHSLTHYSSAQWPLPLGLPCLAWVGPALSQRSWSEVEIPPAPPAPRRLRGAPRGASFAGRRP